MLTFESTPTFLCSEKTLLFGLKRVYSNTVPASNKYKKELLIQVGLRFTTDPHPNGRYFKSRLSCTNLCRLHAFIVWIEEG